ncbi:MAG: rRNA maturation RNase YbeY [Rhodospirillaceae bacterium]|nr:rRNA maturation RNase YbeY [Rhodospirillaceae bacterium]
MSKKVAVNIDVSILSSGWTREHKTIAALCKRWARHALDFAKKHLPKKHFLHRANDGVEISLVLTSDARIRTLNRAYRGKDKPTNVLSFPAMDGGVLPPGMLVLGDVVLALETARKEAKSEKKSFRDHTAHLVTHGVLHLLGYDHEQDRDARNMERMERLILADLGVADPYAGTVPVGPSSRRKPEHARTR